MKFDHAIIAVHDLDQARATFRSHGFTVVKGGEHASGYTHNALIVFADGAYLELMAPTDPKLLANPQPPVPGNYLSLFEAGEGIAGYAFRTPDLDGQVRRVRQAGIEIGDPQSGGRRRPDGVELRWRTAMFADMSLPFLVSDDTPRRGQRVVTFDMEGFRVGLHAGILGARGELPTELHLSSTQPESIAVHGCRLVLMAD